MALRVRLHGRQETLNDFELAAEVRYWEGLELMIAGENAGRSISHRLLGRDVVEVRMFRFDGVRPGDYVDARPAAVQNRWRRVLPGSPTRKRPQLVVLDGNAAKCPRHSRPPPTACFRHPTGTMDKYRLPELVVQHALLWRSAPQTEAIDVYCGVNWLRDHRTQLWS